MAIVERSTYVRKLGPNCFEYGVVERSNNFRKRPDNYIAAGVETTVYAAETARGRLSPSETAQGK